MGNRDMPWHVPIFFPTVHVFFLNCRKIISMSDDNKIIFSMYRVGKTFPPHRQVLKDISLSFFLGAKIGIIGLNGSGNRPF